MNKPVFWSKSMVNGMVLCALLGITPSSVLAQGGICNTSCMATAGMGNTCMVTATITAMCNTVRTANAYTAGYFTGGMFGMSVACNVGAQGDQMASAIRTVGQPVSSYCSFGFNKACNLSTGTSTGPAGVTCQVNAADGLPVELLGLSIE